MASNTVKVRADELAGAIKEVLNETKDLAERAVLEAVDETAKEVVKKTKGASPVKKETYKRGWTSKVTKARGRGRYGRTAHNRTRYMLAHLLQNGHGGPRPAPPHPHITTDEETEAIFVKKLKSEMNKA